ncbi:uncharacterized protein BO97DRAFT_86861 [Aspergillus homomorphus CBS 101889]|uniref:Uncharacterized protein n=1 Tax=Aspergillus homomorphus (strain CBS 101889) TaxID=1450537 RepID=A0A395HWN2_ASPHC|nr:hypothetical protein BO97DRAFT_86861 [Aspergillus homomorphus CBS 101889]RAL11823.1 hypothetical protein BO97DRAFT_86861 [Aspergillus homomorphus CBS 101889]
MAIQHPATTGVPKSITLIVGLKIAVMVPVLHQALSDRLEIVSQEPPVTCRIWLKRSLQDLDDEGYIKLTHSVDGVAQEADDAAVDNRARGIRSVGTSYLSKA